MAVESTSVRDVVVVIPGITGSTLVDADDRAVWSVRPGSLVNAVRTFGRSVTSLELPADIGDEHPGDGVRAVGLMQALHVVPGLWSPVAGYSSLLKHLRSERFHLVEEDGRGSARTPNLVLFAYDWRLSNRYNGRLLGRRATDCLERWRQQPGMEDAKLVLVCHSMGGLVAKWFLEQEGGADITRSLITIGTPHRGAVKSLGSLVNGVDPGLGPLRLRLSELARSLPSMHQLLPTYSCLVTADGRRTLEQQPVSGLDRAMTEDAAAFHAALEGPQVPPYTHHKIVGIRQPTPTTARLVRGELHLDDRIDERDQGGDGTVPRLAAEPVAGRGLEVHEVADQHGELHNARGALDLVDGILSREELVWEDVARETFGVAMDEVWTPQDDPVLFVPDLEDRRLQVTVLDELGAATGPPSKVRPDGSATLSALPPGGYRAVVTSPVPGGPMPVTRPFLVWDPAQALDEAPAGRPS